MLNAIANEALKQWACRAAIYIAVFAIAMTLFWCHRQDEMREIRGTVYGVVETINE